MKVYLETLKEVAELTAAYVKAGLTFECHYSADKAAYVVELTGGY